jgi:hypothetical protein
MLVRRPTASFRIAAALVFVGSTPNIADARGPAAETDEARIAHCIRVASQGKPWLEKTLWGLRDQEGGWIGAAVLNSNGSHDLGPLQVNTWWVPRLARQTGRPEEYVRHWLRNDPCFNAEVARWIFLTALAATNDYWKAIGLYHSPTEWRQRKYAASVAEKLQRRYGASLFHARQRSPS